MNPKLRARAIAALANLEIADVPVVSRVVGGRLVCENGEITVSGGTCVTRIENPEHLLDGLVRALERAGLTIVDGGGAA